MHSRSALSKHSTVGAANAQSCQLPVNVTRVLWSGCQVSSALACSPPCMVSHALELQYKRDCVLGPRKPTHADWLVRNVLPLPERSLSRLSPGSCWPNWLQGAPITVNPWSWYLLYSLCRSWYCPVNPHLHTHIPGLMLARMDGRVSVHGHSIILLAKFCAEVVACSADHQDSPPHTPSRHPLACDIDHQNNLTPEG
jgi:hypothetical protein